MEVEIKQKGGMGRTSTYSTIVAIPDTNNALWDSSGSNGMNDYYEYATTGAGTWLWLFDQANYEGNRTIVQPNTTEEKLANGNFDFKVASFQVCNYDPS